MNIISNATTPEKSSEPIQEMSPCQVFLIEDDVDDRLLAQRELEKCEHVDVVVPFPDGKELLSYMKRQGFMDRSVILFAPLLILVDLEMPRKDGLEVIKELKSDSFLKPIPLVVITGTESRRKIQEARRLGASGVFKKPLDRKMLNAYFQDGWQWPPQELWNS
ncbi:MAG: response regulator [Alphaproteobacteria bacterium]|nr:response regulator [Alphaproteobacteria bacterium]